MKRSTGLTGKHGVLRQAAAATAVLVFGLCASAAEAKTLRWSSNGDVTSMDPYAYYTTTNAGFLQNIYEPLVRHDRNLKFEPSLATSWQMIEPTVWRFKLRQGVKFHNGNAFNADDVVASLLRASHANSPYRAATVMIKDVVKVDTYTVDIVLHDKFPTLLNDLVGIFIMDKEWMEQNNTLQPVNPSKGEDSYASSNANGTGPFILKSRRPDAETVLTVNPGWWDKAAHNITEVVFRPIKSDATRISALLSGEIDLITAAPLQDVDRLKANANIDTLVGRDIRVIFFGLNQGASELNASNIKGKNPLADPRVRKALHQAIDVETLVKRVMRGMATPTANLVAPEIQGYDPDMSKVIAPYDVASAKKLLAEAGYPDGFEVGLDCPTDRYINGEQVCQAVAAMWARAGIRASLTAQTMTNYMKKMMSGGADIYMLGWANSPQLDAFALFNNILHSKTQKSGSWNPGRYANPKVDELVAKIGTELDMGQRQRLMSEAFRIHREEFGTIPLYIEPLVWATAKNVKVVQTPDNKVRLWWVTMP